MKGKPLSYYATGTVCRCGSANFTCHQFEEVAIIMLCNDCRGYKIISNCSLQKWYDIGKTYYAPFGHDYPFFVEEGKNIKQINGLSWWTKDKLAKKKVYQMPKKHVLKEYKNSIKDLKQKYDSMVRKYNAYKKKIKKEKKNENIDCL